MSQTEVIIDEQALASVSGSMNTYIKAYREALEGAIRKLKLNSEDWNDEDYCDFKVKTKELALSFFVLESTIGTNETLVGKNYHKMLGDFLNLTKQERMIFLRKAINC